MSISVAKAWWLLNKNGDLNHVHVAAWSHRLSSMNMLSNKHFYLKYEGQGEYYFLLLIFVFQSPGRPTCLIFFYFLELFNLICYFLFLFECSHLTIRDEPTKHEMGILGALNLKKEVKRQPVIFHLFCSCSWSWANMGFGWDNVDCRTK